MAETLKAVAVTVEDLEMSYGDRKILDKACLALHEGDRIGLVGCNGCGKSTFMKILCGAEIPDGGSVVKRKGLISGFLPQEFILDEDSSVYENIFSGVKHISDMIAEYEKLPHDSTKAHHLEHEISLHDGWNIENKLDTAMTKLKCPPKDSGVKNLSGGEKRRVALARALVSEPDLLILDEPTNHLDTESIEWLEEFMRNYQGACVFVTHDRYFLDRVSSRIVELDRGIFNSYKGNYSNYLEEKAQRMEREETEEAKRQKFLKKELEWVRRGPKARTTKAKHRVDRYYDVASIKAPERIEDVELIIPLAERLGNRVVDLKNVSVSYGGRVLFKDFSLEIEPGEKIGIIGPNGAGKTTLIKTILGISAPSEGKVEISPNTQFNYIDQERLELDDEKSVVEEIGEGRDFVTLGNENISIWGYLKRFLFEDERIRTKVGRLSGGERARLLLAKILKNGGNFIVLDEPTNDLDLSTLRLLEDALASFDGCVLLVSHDRYFLNRVCTATIAFEKDGNLSYNVGGYDYYMSKRRDFYISSEEKTKPAKEQVPSKDEKPKARKLKWKEREELENMEGFIMEVEEEIEELHALFSSPEFFKESPDKIKEAQSQLDDAQERKERLYARWEELEAIKENEKKAD